MLSTIAPGVDQAASVISRIWFTGTSRTCAASSGMGAILATHILVSVLSGLVIVDKPQGWTSHDVVGRMRRLAGTRKVGHAGTLDPMATGVLVLGINKATRLLTYIVGTSKTYTATIRLGETTITDDAEGEVTEARNAADVTDDAVAAGVAALTGPIQQVPSSVSAIKVNGERSYARVRSGEEVKLAARPVTIHRFDIHSITRIDGGRVVDVDVTVECSSGTYIRALARDLGNALGVGGHLTALRRTQVGPYSLDQARTLEELAEELEVLEMSLAARALMPNRELSEEETTGDLLRPPHRCRPGSRDPGRRHGRESRRSVRAVGGAGSTAGRYRQLRETGAGLCSGNRGWAGREPGRRNRHGRILLRHPDRRIGVHHHVHRGRLDEEGPERPHHLLRARR